MSGFVAWTPPPHPCPAPLQQSHPTHFRAPDSLPAQQQYPVHASCVPKQTGGALWTGQSHTSIHPLTVPAHPPGFRMASGSVKPVPLNIHAGPGSPQLGEEAHLADVSCAGKKGRRCGEGSGGFRGNMLFPSTTRPLLTGLPTTGGNSGAGACREKPPLFNFPRRCEGQRAGVVVGWAPHRVSRRFGHVDSCRD